MTVTRSALWWTFQATLPHCKDTLGLSTSDDRLWTWGTDGYTIGISRAYDPDQEPCEVVLTHKIALDVMRWLRPTRKAEHVQEIQLIVRGEEFHLGAYDVSQLPGELVDSAVFAYDWHDPDDGVTPAPARLDYLREHIARISKQRVEMSQMVYQGPLLARFDKATRSTMDRVRFYPRRLDSRHGAAIVTVGPDFLGAISALTYDDVEPMESWIDEH